jgi:hypothetical protein
MTHRWDDDHHLLDDLSDALRETGPVDAIAAYGSGAYAWRTIDEDLLLASLSFDSSLEQAQQRRSGPDDERVLVFTASPLSLELEVRPGHIAGQIIPPGAAEIQVEVADGAAFQIEADDTGFFTIPGTLHGLIRLRCDTPTARLVTDWVRL